MCFFPLPRLSRFPTERTFCIFPFHITNRGKHARRKRIRSPWQHTHQLTSEGRFAIFRGMSASGVVANLAYLNRVTRRNTQRRVAKMATEIKAAQEMRCDSQLGRPRQTEKPPFRALYPPYRARDSLDTISSYPSQLSYLFFLFSFIYSRGHRYTKVGETGYRA